MATSLAVFTRDLRVRDNPMLAAAAAGDFVVPVFVIDDDIIRRFASHASRLAFLLDSLADLRGSLSQRGGTLVVRRGRWSDEVLALAAQTGATAIHLSDDYSAYARRRLAQLERAARSQGIEVSRHPGITLAEPGELRPGKGGRRPAASSEARAGYQVFGPYYQRWRSAPLRDRAPSPRKITVPARITTGRIPALDELTSARPAPGRPPGGENEALDRLRAWAAGGLASYATSRDVLAADGISRLSPYLHLGCLSPRTVAAELGGLRGGDEFLRQIAWRDFFHQILATRPDASWADFRSRGDRWRQDSRALRAWQDGLTGYPVVDAAMRQLAAEAFMHNRARMIVASFLTKDLYLDWRAGARFFMSALADGDIACNQLNWQWVAGTGTDTNPSRIFSPVRQSMRFDPDGEYLRRYLPELAGVPGNQIHDPPADARRACGYPEPIVDHQAAIAEYRTRTRRPAPRT